MFNSAPKRVLTELHKKRISESMTGENNPNYGKSPSEETRMKMSESTKGENHPMWGKTHSDETRKKISEAKIGENHPMWGKTHSEETRMKMSEAKIGENNPMWGKTPSEETRKKMSEANTGKTHSVETRMKMSEAQKGENHPRAKLNEEQVLQILFLRFYRKVQPKKIAEALNIVPNHVSSICTRKTWTDQYDAFFEMEPYKHLKPQR